MKIDQTKSSHVCPKDWNMTASLQVACSPTPRDSPSAHEDDQLSGTGEKLQQCQRNWVYFVLWDLLLIGLVRGFTQNRYEKPNWISYFCCLSLNPEISHIFLFLLNSAVLIFGEHYLTLPIPHLQNNTGIKSSSFCELYNNVFVKYTTAAVIL